MARCQFNDVIPILDVRNISAALRFYTERLGFEIAFRFSADPDNYAGVRRDDVFLDMQWQHEDDFRSGSAGNLRIRIRVDDPDALFAEYKDNGLFGDETQLRNTAWGTREFGFRAPDGNGLIFYRDL